MKQWTGEVTFGEVENEFPLVVDSGFIEGMLEIWTDSYDPRSTSLTPDETRALIAHLQAALARLESTDAETK